MDTSDLEVGKRKLADLEAEERGKASDQPNGKLTFGDALEIFSRHEHRRVRI